MSVVLSGAPGMSFLSPFSCLESDQDSGDTKNSGALGHSKTEVLDIFLWCMPWALPDCPRAGFHKADTPSGFMESPNLKRAAIGQYSWPADCLTFANGVRQASGSAHP